jgi:hypothetical protein
MPRVCIKHVTNLRNPETTFDPSVKTLSSEHKDSVLDIFCTKIIMRKFATTLCISSISFDFIFEGMILKSYSAEIDFRKLQIQLQLRLLSIFMQFSTKQSVKQEICTFETIIRLTQINIIKLLNINDFHTKTIRLMYAFYTHHTHVAKMTCGSKVLGPTS